MKFIQENNMSTVEAASIMASYSSMKSVLEKRRRNGMDRPKLPTSLKNAVIGGKYIETTDHLKFLIYNNSNKVLN